MKKFIKLTRVLTDLNEKGRAKVEENVKDKILTIGDGSDDQEPQDEYGRTAEFYRSVGMSVPPELQGELSKRNRDSIKVEFSGDVDVTLTKEDWDETLFPFLCNLDFVESFEATENYTLIGFQSGAESFVTETVEQIEYLINS